MIKTVNVVLCVFYRFIQFFLNCMLLLENITPRLEHLAWGPGGVISPSSPHREGAFRPLPSETWPELTLLWRKPITLVFLSHVDSLEFPLSNFFLFSMAAVEAALGRTVSKKADCLDASTSPFQGLPPPSILGRREP